jgi:hypothetical protein
MVDEVVVIEEGEPSLENSSPLGIKVTGKDKKPLTVSFHSEG